MPPSTACCQLHQRVPGVSERQVRSIPANRQRIGVVQPTDTHLGFPLVTHRDGQLIRYFGQAPAGPPRASIGSPRHPQGRQAETHRDSNSYTAAVQMKVKGHQDQGRDPRQD